jgi:hypothetical protein
MRLFLSCLAVGGFVLIVLGRRLIIEDARSFSAAWTVAIRFLPFADIMYLARFWESAKTGALMSIIGTALILPLGGEILWEQKRSKDGASSSNPLGLIESDDKDEVIRAVRAAEQRRIAFKEEQLKMLLAKMAAWYEAIETKRATLHEAPATEVRNFNEEAAAYAALHRMTKDEAAELAKLYASRPATPEQVPDAQARSQLAPRRST